MACGNCDLKPVVIAFVEPVPTAGAILTQESDIQIVGTAAFANNSALRDGGEESVKGVRLLREWCTVVISSIQPW